MIDTDRLSAVADGLFQAGLDGAATVPITNYSSEGMYLEFGDGIGEVDLVEHNEILQVDDDSAQAAVDTLTLEQKRQWSCTERKWRFGTISQGYLTQSKSANFLKIGEEPTQNRRRA